MEKQQPATDDESRRQAREAFFDWLFTNMAKRQLAKKQTQNPQTGKDTK